VKNQRISFIDSLVPFLIIGISIAVFVALMVLLSYVILWGLLIGGILWIVLFIKEKLFPSKKPQTEEKKGRVIDYDEIK